jgi:uncharacterized protein
MTAKLLVILVAGLMHLWQPANALSPKAAVLAVQEQPISIGVTLTVQSIVLAEQRRINVHFPPEFDANSKVALPVLYMPDGGMAEDFLHIAGLLQVSVGNNSMRPFLLVGIENTQRRRDLTGPTTIAEDNIIAPVVGGSAAFREFLRTELKPLIKARYRITDECAIVGESLAGLFVCLGKRTNRKLVIETLLLEPDLFDRYIAIDPSLWWNDQFLIRNAGRLIKTGLTQKGLARVAKQPTLFIATSSERGMADAAQRLLTALESNRIGQTLRQMPEESHATIYHPAALHAFRSVFAPAAKLP